MLFITPIIGSRNARRQKGGELLNFDKMNIKLKDKMCVHTDGEHVGFYDEFTVEPLPGILKVREF